MKNVRDSYIQSDVDTPEILYKYRSLSENNFAFTRDIFLKNEIYFPHPDQLNDPFDCKIPPSFKNVTKESLTYYIEKVETKNHGIDSTQIKAARNNVNSYDIETIIEALKNKCNEKHIQNVGVLSLSEKPLDIRMWSHYSDSHKGICIGFDFTKLLFIFNGTLIPPFTVKYPRQNEYPLWDYLDDDYDKIINKLYLTKAIDWEYEQEWRIILPEKGGTVQEFDPAALVAVYLGCQINKEQKERVINWCSQRKIKPKIYETTRNKVSYSLQKKEIAY